MSQPLRQFGLVPLYDPFIAFAVKATAGKLPPGEGGASPCSGFGGQAVPPRSRNLHTPCGAGAVAKALTTRGHWSASTAWRRRQHPPALSPQQHTRVLKFTLIKS